MPYRREVFRRGFRFHIYNRGFLKQQLFYCAEDYLRFLSKLSFYLGDEYCLYAYALMPNHFHFLVEQKTNKQMSEFMRDVQLSYAKYFSLKYKKIGSVFESRFKAKRIDSRDYLLRIVHYIHQNPLMASLTSNLEDWRWSSFWSYVSDVSDSCVSTEIVLDEFHKCYPGRDFREFSEAINDNPDENNILIDSPKVIQSRDD